ncbi:choline/carnitine/betaine transporter [Sporosarcina sp. P13]|uniref:BCCT family transporter n=1 Tax=Sporosarcina sp. P13 TaxID=2048263 RepID=UPI000C172EF7|nr:BCCT family transporter [Sporosarcina sp. P13]PIC64130.1 choline/carnitine/betaine transporter [Sporosarcina sp. P13]
MRFKTIDKQILAIALSLVAILIVPILINPVKGTSFLNSVLNSITTNFGPLYLWACLGIFGFLLWLAFSRFGKIRLGNTKPEFTTFSWLALIFTAGIGSGIMYWGIIEWAFYYSSPPYGMAAESVEAANFASTYGMFHWGFSAWAIYCVPSIPIAYAVYVKGQKSYRLSTACRGIIGNKADGLLGKVIDVCFMFGLIGGIGTSLALGTPLLAEGVHSLFGFEKTLTLNLSIVVTLMIFFCICLYFGLKKGLKRLSDWNLYLYIAIAVFIFIFGPTAFIIATFTDSVGVLFQNFFRMSLYTDPIGKSGFSESWTLFYWGWWFSYAPFTGMFAARISKGRTIKGLILGQLLGGTLGCWIAFAIFGNTSMYFQLNNIVPVLDILQNEGAPAAILASLSALPLGGVVMVLYLLIAAIFLATTVNSAAYTLSDVASINLREGEEPARWYRVFWGIVLTSISIVLMYGDGLKALQTLSIITALPLVFIILLMIASFMKWVYQGEKDGIHIYEGAQYDKPEEQTVEITIERGKKNKNKGKVIEKENMI